MNANDHSASATMKALREIFEANQDKPFEVRWALAKSSEAYRGFQIRCSTSAKVLLAFGVPLLLFWVVSRNTTWRDGEASLTTIILAVLYVTISFAVSWKLGIKAAKTKMARLRRSSKVPGEHPTE